VKKAVGRCSNRDCLATENQARQDRADAEKQRHAEAQRQKDEKQRRAGQQAAEEQMRCQSAVNQDRDSLVREGRINVLDQFQYKWRNNVKFYMDERWSSSYGFTSFTGAGTWVNGFNATMQWKYTCSVGCTEWGFVGDDWAERWVGPKVSCTLAD